MTNIGKPIDCWTCGKLGHFSRECTKKRPYLNKKNIGKSYQKGVYGRHESVKTYNIALCGNPNSCLISIGSSKFRGLVDTGAELSVMSKRAYDLKNKSTLEITKVNLKSVNGNSLYVRGRVELKFKIGSIYVEHPFLLLKT